MDQFSYGFGQFFTNEGTKRKYFISSEIAFLNVEFLHYCGKVPHTSLGWGGRVSLPHYPGNIPCKNNTKVRYLTILLIPKMYLKQTTVELQLVVSALPSEGPKIRGGRPRYQLGEYVRVNCTSGRSKPPTQLMWFINGDPVRYHLLQYHQSVSPIIQTLLFHPINFQFNQFTKANLYQYRYFQKLPCDNNWG